MDIHKTSTNNSSTDVMKEKEEYNKMRKEQIIALVQRQTDYTYDEAKDKLEQSNYNFMYVLEKYMELDKIREEKMKEEQKEMKSKSVNQKIYGEIRGFMDTASRNYERRKQMMARQGYVPVVRDISSSNTSTTNEVL